MLKRWLLIALVIVAVPLYAWLYDQWSRAGITAACADPPSQSYLRASVFCP